MAKRFDISIDGYQMEPFANAIRAKGDVIVVWMRAVKAFLTNSPAPAKTTAATLSIVATTMSRLFVVMKDGGKIFSVNFPFYVGVEDGEYVFRSRGGVKIDHKTSSEILALVQTRRVLEIEDFEQFLDPIFDAVDVQATLWSLLRELMLAEDGYLRYDWDTLRAKGNIHPEHHLDINYSSSGSFKIGLHKMIDHDALVGILDMEVECHYLTQPLLAANESGKASASKKS